MNIRAYICSAVLLAAVAASLCARIIVAPVPWVPADEGDRNGTAADGITFLNLPPAGDIFIYTITGTLVANFSFNDPSLRAKWLGKDNNGRDAASGIYVWVARSADGTTKTGKLIVVR